MARWHAYQSQTSSPCHPHEVKRPIERILDKVQHNLEKEYQKRVAQEQAERLDIQKQLEKMRENELFTPDGQSPTVGRDP